MNTPLLVSVDVHRKTNTVHLVDGRGQEAAPRFTVDNNRPGIEAFVKKVTGAVAAGDYDTIHIAVEATGWYWWHFFQTLAHAPLGSC